VAAIRVIGGFGLLFAVIRMAFYFYKRGAVAFNNKAYAENAEEKNY
jgi:hypothetical protein